MLPLGYAAGLRHRPRSQIHSLGMAVLLILLIQPMHAFSAGLVLLRQFPAISRLLNHTEEKFVLEEDISYKFDEKL